MDTSPEALGLDTEEIALPEKVPGPESLGLDVDHTSPQALGLETSDEPGAFGQADAVLQKGYQGAGALVSGAKAAIGGIEKGWDYLSKGAEALDRDLPYGFQVAKDVVSGVGAAPGLIGKGISNAWDVFDRTTGTAVGRGLDLAASTINNLSGTQGQNLYDLAQQREIQDGVIKNQAELSFKGLFPVRLVEDIAAPAFASAFDWTGSKVSAAAKYAPDSQTAKTLTEAGKFLTDLSPAAGLIGSIAVADVTLGASLPSFGTLTEGGEIAQQAGALESGFAKQVNAGQRAIMNVGDNPVNFGKVGVAVANKAAELSVKIGASVPGKLLSKVSTYSAFPEINGALDQLTAARNQSEYYAKQLFRSSWAQADKFGLDLSDPEAAAGLQSALENPSKFNPSKFSDKVSPEAAEGMFTFLDGQLQQTRSKAIQSGLSIPDKLYPEALEEGTTQERYVPRQTNPGKVGEKANVEMADKAVQILEQTKQKQLGEFNSIMGDADTAVALADEMGAKVTASSAGKYTKLRDVDNTAAMNAKISQNFGVDNYFSSDVVSAYVDKIHQVNKDLNDANFTRSIANQFGLSDEAFLAKKLEANARVSEAYASGRLVDPADLHLVNLKDKDFVSFGELPLSTRTRLSGLTNVAPDLEGIEGLKVPRQIGDLLTENLSPQRKEGLMAGAIASQNIYKLFLTQNPGFYIRNWFQSYTMGQAGGVSIADNVKAFAGMVNGSGNWAERKEAYDSLTRGMGAFGKIEDDLSSVGRLRRIAETEASAADYAGDNAMKQLLYQFRQMGSTDKWGSFLKDLWSGTKNGSPAEIAQAIRDNPIYRTASSIGHGGEQIPQFAFFNKLMDSGLSAEEAIAQTKKQFLNFQNTRAATMTASTVFPFANHAIKNAEVTLRLLAASPENALMYGRGGAFAHAIENWAGWDPENGPDKYKKMMGNGWSDDMIYLPVMPGKQAMENNQDLLRSIVYNVYGAAGVKDGNQLMLSLPSNYHALSMIDPTRMDELTSPLWKSGVALMGTDPFTGKPLQLTDEHNKWLQRMSVASDQFIGPMAPRTMLNAGRGIMDKLMEGWADNASKLGMDSNTAKAVLTPENQAKQQQVSKALAKAFTMWRGTYTQLDNDMGFRIMGALNDMKNSQKAANYMFTKGKIDQKTYDEYNANFSKDAQSIVDMDKIKTDYEQRLKKTNAPAWKVNYLGQ